MNRAFTLIEAIFVVVIIGIMAAVAWPRFVSVSDDAVVSKMSWFVDVLNRSVGPEIWSNILQKVSKAKGSVRSAELASYPYLHILYDISSKVGPSKMAHFVQIPKMLTLNVDGKTSQGKIHEIPLDNCAPFGTVIAPGVGRIASAKIKDKIYNIGCIDGNEFISPHFFLDDGHLVLKK